MKYLLIILCVVSLSAAAQKKQPELKVHVPKSTQQMIVELEQEAAQVQALQQLNLKNKRLLFQTLLGDRAQYHPAMQARFENDTLYILVDTTSRVTSAGASKVTKSDSTKTKPKGKNK